jgi:hypothetical protein
VHEFPYNTGMIGSILFDGVFSNRFKFVDKLKTITDERRANIKRKFMLTQSLPKLSFMNTVCNAEQRDIATESFNMDIYKTYKLKNSKKILDDYDINIYDKYLKKSKLSKRIKVFKSAKTIK